MRGIRKVEDEFLKCRSWGHEWDSFTPLRRRRGWGEVLSLRCTRCTTERYDTIDSNGDLSTREYKYPDGYKLAGTFQGVRLTASDLRKEIVRRMRVARAEGRSLRLVREA